MQMLQNFLENKNVRYDVSLITWKEFFNVVVHEFETTHKHHYLLSFLKKVVVAYERSDRAEECMVDLMQLNVSKLLSGE